MTGMDPQELLEQAAFIFRGSVQRLNATTVSLVDPDERTAVVRIDQILRAPSALRAQVGSELTIQLREPGGVRPGQQTVFFTSGWLYGETLAVTEVGHFDDLPQRLSEEIDAEGPDRVRIRLRERVATSDLIVLGAIVELRQSRRARRRRAPESEHDPIWWEARIGIEAILKGQHGDETITFLFPASRDVMWYRSPKPEPHQDGIWLLHRGEAPLVDEAAYTALDPLDFQPRDQREQIASLAG